MATNDYHLISHWRVEATLKEVYTILIDPREYPRWWPQAFLGVAEKWEDGEQFCCFHVKGYLPYTIEFQARLAEQRYPYEFTVETRGDFNGRAVWSLEREGDGVHVTVDWRVRVTKPLIRYTSFLLKPLFASNHYWTMRHGEEGLRRELRRLPAHSWPGVESRAPEARGRSFTSTSVRVQPAALGI